MYLYSYSNSAVPLIRYNQYINIQYEYIVNVGLERHTGTLYNSIISSCRVSVWACERVSCRELFHFSSCYAIWRKKFKWLHSLPKFEFPLSFTLWISVKRVRLSAAYHNLVISSQRNSWDLIVHCVSPFVHVVPGAACRVPTRKVTVVITTRFHL